MSDPYSCTFHTTAPRNDLSFYRSRNLLGDPNQEYTPRLLPRRIMKMHESVTLTQAIETDTSPRSQRIATDFIILNFEPAAVSAQAQRT